VVAFTSSINSDKRLLKAVIKINQAHVVMLMEQKIIEWQDGAKPVLTGGWAIPTKKLDKNDPDLLEKDIDKSKTKKLFFKSKKFSETKTSIPDQKNQDTQKISIKPIFNV
jgi:hypothetical protein